MFGIKSKTKNLSRFRLRNRSTALVALVVIIVVGLLSSGTYALFFAGSSQPASSPANQSVNLQKGLIGHWKFDGNLKDAAPYGDNASIVGGSVTPTTGPNGVANTGYAFSAGYNRLSVALPSFSYPGLTLSAWINPSVYPSERSTILEGQLTAAQAYYLSLASDGSVQTYWYGRNPEGYFSSGAGTVPLNQWSLVQAVWTDSSVTLYVNGQLKTTSSSSGVGLVPNSVIFGAENSARNFVGSMSDIRIYNRAVNATEAKALYDSYGAQTNINSLSQGLIGHWKLDGNAKDSTPYANNGTINGAVPTTDRHGSANGAMSFDASSSNYITAGNNPISGTNPFTLSAWINTSQVSRYSGALSIGPSCCSHSAYIGTVASAQVGASNSIGGGFYGTNIGSGVSITNQWELVTLTFTGGTGGTTTIYVNGTPKASTTFTPSLVAGPVQIGKIGTDTTYNFNGSIDDARIYSRALSQQEIQNLFDFYNSQINLGNTAAPSGHSVSLSKGLVAFWPLDGTKDETPYQRNATIAGSPTLASDQSGAAGEAYHFNGSTDYLSLGTNADYDFPSFSVSLWAKADSATQTHVKDLIGKGNWNDPNLWYIGFKNATDVSFVYGTGSWQTGPSYPLSSYDVTQWHNYVGVATPTQQLLYIDGVLVNSVSKTHVSVANTYDLQIARSSYYNNDFAGSMSDVRIYNRALNLDEIQALYNSKD